MKTRENQTQFKTHRETALMPVTVWLGLLFRGKVIRLGNEILDSFKFGVFCFPHEKQNILDQFAKVAL